MKTTPACYIISVKDGKIFLISILVDIVNKIKLVISIIRIHLVDFTTPCKGTKFDFT